MIATAALRDIATVIRGETKHVQLWRGDRRWFRTRFGAYCDIAKAVILKRYPRWLEDQLTHGELEALALDAGIPDWRARLDRRIALLWTANEAHFDPRRWRTLVHRLARFMMYVDDRRNKQ